MNPQQQQIAQAYAQQLQNMNPRGSALGQAAAQVQAYGNQYQQQPMQQPQFNIPQMLQNIGQFFHQIGHPMAQTFNQFHGFNFAQTPGNTQPQGQLGKQGNNLQIAGNQATPPISFQGPTRDNQITNNLVKQGKLPANASEIYQNAPSSLRK